MKQISGQSARLNRNLERMYRVESLAQDQGPSATEVENLLPAVISGFDKRPMILDGLEELAEPRRLLSFLPLLLRQTTSTLKAIIFSRVYLPMQNALKDYPQLRIDGDANTGDINIFISTKHPDDDPDWDPNLLDTVKAMLLDKAEDILLYASLIVGRLRGSLPQNEVVKRFKSLQKGLMKAYEANLKRILDQDDEGDNTLKLKPFSGLQTLTSLSRGKNYLGP